MKTFWCVMTVFYDSGRVTAGIVDMVEAARKPKNSYVEKANRDIYTDWFSDIDEAERFVKEAYEC